MCHLALCYFDYCQFKNNVTYIIKYFSLRKYATELMCGTLYTVFTVVEKALESGNKPEYCVVARMALKMGTKRVLRQRF